jgi:hypothetical protein
MHSFLLILIFAARCVVLFSYEVAASQQLNSSIEHILLCHYMTEIRNFAIDKVIVTFVSKLDLAAAKVSKYAIKG